MDEVALVTANSGVFTNLTFSIRQNVGVGGVPIGPGDNESAEAYLVIAPYDNDPTYPQSYGTPLISVSGLEAFLAEWQIANGTLADCTGVAVQGATAPVDGSGATFLPIGASVQAKTVIGTEQHCAQCTNLLVSASACDLFAVWIRSNAFEAFRPTVALTYATE